jgi:hypothetical protein
VIAQRAVRAREQGDGSGRLLIAEGLQRCDGGRGVARLELELRARQPRARGPFVRDALRELEPLVAPLDGALQLRRVRGKQVIREWRVSVFQPLREEALAASPVAFDELREPGRKIAAAPLASPLRTGSAPAPR